VITAAAFCPHPPALVAAVAGRRAVELDEARAACAAAILALAATDPDQIVIIGSGSVAAMHSPVARGSLAGFGIPFETHLGSPACGGALELPLSLTVGAWLISIALGERTGALGFSVGPDFAATRVAAELLALAEQRRVALVVMGDGSARRSTAAPGYLDERAKGFDDQVAAALAGGDGDALAELDLALGHELLAAGVPAWRAAGALLAGDPFAGDLLYNQAPYGVGYFVASWQPGG
jgi:hypothetical protein